jgi:hypothetical protein
MTGNDKPNDAAVLSRLVILNFNKFLKRDELQKVSEVAEHTNRFSEFLGVDSSTLPNGAVNVFCPATEQSDLFK